jgi:Domain of unknown function (DUF4160)
MLISELVRGGMGKLLILTKYIFLIYGSDVNELRKHVHVTYNRRGFKRSCKFWLEPTISLDESKMGDFNERELLEIEKLIGENEGVLKSQLEKFHKRQRVNAIRK